MAKKPTFEELEQRVKGFEAEADTISLIFLKVRLKFFYVNGIPKSRRSYI